MAHGTAPPWLRGLRSRLRLRQWGARYAPVLTQRLFTLLAPWRQRRLALDAVARALAGPAGDPDVVGDLVAPLRGLLEREPSTPSVKGDVPLRRQQAFYARQALERLAAPMPPAEALAIVLHTWGRIASTDVYDGGAFRLYVESLRRYNADTLTDLVDFLQPRVALHLTCQPRLQRARDSVASFTTRMPELSHLFVVGDPSLAPGRFRFSRAERMLWVPAGDMYEALPQKVIAAFACLALIPGVESVVKLDDDHRLGDEEALRAALDSARGPVPVQAGVIFQATNMFASNRCWHIGKCADEALNDRPFCVAGATTWATGEAGYVVNRAALRVLLFCTLFARDLIDSLIFEDSAVSQLLDAFGGALRQVPDSLGLVAVRDY